MSATAIIRRNDRMMSRRKLFEYQWQEIADYILPRKSDITYQLSPGQKQTAKLYESTALHALELLAAMIHGSLTSSASKWFSLKMRDPALNDLYEVRAWLQECAGRMYLAIAQSNFAQEIHEVYLDLGGFGTGAYYIEEKPIKSVRFNGLLFRALYNSQYCIEEGADGNVNKVYRQFNMPANTALEMFGNNVGEKCRGDALSTKPEKIYTFIHAVSPREVQSGLLGNRNMPFASIYVNKTEKHEIAQGGYNEFPIPVVRWLKTSGEEYGRSPGSTALPDVKSLNKIRELGLKALAKVIDPPMTAERGGVLGKIRLQPAGVTIVRRHDALKPFPSDLNNFKITNMDEDKLKASIRKIFHVDMIEAFMTSDSPQKTATEVRLRYELMQQVLGSTLGRLEGELLNPSVERIFGIMGRSGGFPEAPAILRDQEIDIEYESPLARAQRAGEVTAIEMAYEFAGNLAQAFPDIMDNFDHDKAIKFVAEIRGVPLDILREQSEVLKIRAVRAEKQAKEKQEEDMLLMMDKLKNAGAGIEKLAPLVGASA